MVIKLLILISLSLGCIAFLVLLNRLVAVYSQGLTLQERDAHVTWDRHITWPIPLYLDTGVSTKVEAALTSALRRWRNATGRYLFTILWRVPRKPSHRTDHHGFIPGAVLFTLGPATGTTLDIRDGEIKAARIVLKKDYLEETLTSTLLHELGHALGLPDDPNSRSVMHPDHGMVIQPEDIEEVTRHS